LSSAEKIAYCAPFEEGIFPAEARRTHGGASGGGPWRPGKVAGAVLNEGGLRAPCAPASRGRQRTPARRIWTNVGGLNVEGAHGTRGERAARLVWFWAAIALKVIGLLPAARGAALLVKMCNVSWFSRRRSEYSRSTPSGRSTENGWAHIIGRGRGAVRFWSEAPANRLFGDSKLDPPEREFPANRHGGLFTPGTYIRAPAKARKNARQVHAGAANSSPLRCRFIAVGIFPGNVPGSGGCARRRPRLLVEFVKHQETCWTRSSRQYNPTKIPTAARESR